MVKVYFPTLQPFLANVLLTRCPYLLHKTKECYCKIVIEIRPVKIKTCIYCDML